MRTISFIGISICLIFFSSCSKLDIPPAISESNKIDHWSLAVGNMNTLSETWNNGYLCTGDTNKLEISGRISGGQLVVIVKDISNNTLFNKTYSSISVYEQLLIAPAGTWSIEVKAVNLNGSFSIDLSRKK